MRLTRSYSPPLSMREKRRKARLKAYLTLGSRELILPLPRNYLASYQQEMRRQRHSETLEPLRLRPSYSGESQASPSPPILDRWLAQTNSPGSFASHYP